MTSNTDPRKKRPWFISAFRLVVIAYATILTAMWLMESRLVYPGAYVNRSVSPAGTEFKPFHYDAIDGRSIEGWRIDQPGTTRTVLFFHGNGTKAAWLESLAYKLRSTLNATIVLAEYRGYQFDAVTPNENNVIEDSLAAHAAVSQAFSIPPEDVILYGRSLGGGCAAAVAQKANSKTVILERTFDSVLNVAANRFSIFPIRWLMSNHFDSADRLRSFRGQVIQIHGPPDTVVPIEHARRLHQSIPAENKLFLEVADLGHNDPLPVEILDRVESLMIDPSAGHDPSGRHGIIEPVVSGPAARAMHDAAF